MEERLNKLLSSMGVCSRREADRLIAEGRVLVDGKPAVVGQKAGPGKLVVCDGRVVCGGRDGQEAGVCQTAIDRAPESLNGAGMTRPKPVLLAVNKPKGVVCTASDKDRAPNIVDMIQYPARVYYVGRLDKDSEGLVLMTNQGDLVNKIMRSGNAHEKEYLVTVDRPVTPEFLKKMSGGVWLEELERRTLPCRVEQTGVKSFRIILTQGLNRQIRRMCRACGCNVAALKRIRVMNIHLGELESGSYRQVEGEEYQEFLKRLTHSTNRTYREMAGENKIDGD